MCYAQYVSVFKALGKKKNVKSCVNCSFFIFFFFQDETQPPPPPKYDRVRGAVHHINENRFFFGTWLTEIFFRHVLATFLRGLNKFTCRPTLMRLVSAPCGNTACTCGTTVDDTMPPSGPMACTSCLTLDTMAK